LDAKSARNVSSRSSKTFKFNRTFRTSSIRGSSIPKKKELSDLTWKTKCSNIRI